MVTGLPSHGQEYLDPGFHYQTNDLALASRFFNLHRKHAGNAEVTAELDRMFRAILAGELDPVEARLTGRESAPSVTSRSVMGAPTLEISLGERSPQWRTKGHTGTDLAVSPLADASASGTNATKFTPANPILGPRERIRGRIETP